MGELAAAGVGQTSIVAGLDIRRIDRQRHRAIVDRPLEVAGLQRRLSAGRVRGRELRIQTEGLRVIVDRFPRMFSLTSAWPRWK